MDFQGQQFVCVCVLVLFLLPDIQSTQPDLDVESVTTPEKSVLSKNHSIFGRFYLPFSFCQRGFPFAQCQGSLPTFV